MLISNVSGAQEMSGIEIRDATSSDSQAVSGIVRQLGFAHDPEVIRRRLAELGPSSGFRALVAVANGTVVGLLTLQIVPYVNTDSAGGQIVILAVDSEHRRRGIGSALVHQAERLASTSGCCNVKVFSDQKRADAHAFYESLGYRVDPSKKRFVKNCGR